MKDLKKLGTATLIATGVLVGGGAKAGVYIVPSDIDQFKQKTDQTFYDMYQNQNSAIGKSVNPNAKYITDSVNTSQRVMEGYTIPKVKGVATQGTAITSGATLDLSLIGKRFRVVYTDDGVKVIRFSNDLDVKGSLVKAKSHSNIRCVSSGKYGCTKQSAIGYDYTLDVTTGVVTATKAKEQRTRSCGKWGCSQWSDFYSTDVVSSGQTVVNLLELAKGKRWFDVAQGVVAFRKVDEMDIIRGKRIDRHGNVVVGNVDYRPSHNGKYGS